MDQIQILILIGVVLLGIVGWLHYTINEQRKEIKALWLQIAVIAAATAREFTKLEEKENKKNGK